MDGFDGMFSGRGGRGGLRDRSSSELRAMKREAERDIVQAHKDSRSAHFSPYEKQSLSKWIDSRQRLIMAIEAALRARGEFDGFDGVGSWVKSIPLRSKNIIKKWSARQLNLLVIGLKLYTNPAAAADPRLWSQAIQSPEFVMVFRELFKKDPTPEQFAKLVPQLDKDEIRAAFDKAVMSRSK